MARVEDKDLILDAGESLTLGGQEVNDIDTDGTMAADSDSRLSTQKAIKEYVDNNAPAGTSGSSGTSGTSGSSGTSGDTGDAGTSGSSGTSGTSGATGTSGIIPTSQPGSLVAGQLWLE